jgi:hypothetical protein
MQDKKMGARKRIDEGIEQEEEQEVEQEVEQEEEEGEEGEEEWGKGKGRDVRRGPRDFREPVDPEKEGGRGKEGAERRRFFDDEVEAAAKKGGRRFFDEEQGRRKRSVDWNDLIICVFWILFFLTTKSFFLFVYLNVLFLMHKTHKTFGFYFKRIAI